MPQNQKVRPNLVEFFGQLGLTKRQTQLYLAGLTYGEQPASELAKRILAPRTSVYQDLNRLVQKGVFTKKLIKTLTLFTPLSVESVGYLVHNKLANAKKLCTSYESVSDLLTQLKPEKNTVSNVQYFEGIEGLSRLLDEHSAKDQTILYISGHNCMDPQFRKYVFENYLPASRKHKNKNKIILNDGPPAQEYKQNAAEVYDEFIFIDPKMVKLSTSIAIYENKVAFCSYDTNDLSGVVITNERINADMRRHFCLLKQLLISQNNDAAHKQKAHAEAECELCMPR